MDVYYVAYVDEQGQERLAPVPYAKRAAAEEYADFLSTCNLARNCHVRACSASEHTQALDSFTHVQEEHET